MLKVNIIENSDTMKIEIFDAKLDEEQVHELIMVLQAIAYADDVRHFIKHLDATKLSRLCVYTYGNHGGVTCDHGGVEVQLLTFKDEDHGRGSTATGDTAR